MIENYDGWSWRARFEILMATMKPELIVAPQFEAKSGKYFEITTH